MHHIVITDREFGSKFDITMKELVGQVGSYRFEGVLDGILMVVTSRCGDYIINNSTHILIYIYKYNTLNIIKD